MLKEVVVKAYNVSKKAHEGQKRKFSGLDYFTHPKAVARFVEELTHDECLVAVALLHDVIEDTNVTYKELLVDFGYHIANLVRELTNDKEYAKGERKKDYILWKMSTMSDNALLIKLCDRLHNILFLEEDTTKEDIDFVRRSYTNTRYIMSLLREQRKRLLDKDLTKEQNMCFDRINTVLGFIRSNYSF